MNSKQQNLIQDTFTASNEARIHFGQVIGQLIEAGVESYTVDYRSCKTTYHLLNDETLNLESPASEYAIAGDFSAAAVQSTIKGAQQGTVMYPEFKRLSMQAGCVGYTVWIAGRHVTYYGRKGETHLEHFPS
jgi:uncharacterized protein YbcV (DUF1398 family)